MLLVKKISIHTVLTQVKAEWVMFSPKKIFFLVWTTVRIVLFVVVFNFKKIRYTDV